jgi:hypothetical protein
MTQPGKKTGRAQNGPRHKKKNGLRNKTAKGKNGPQYFFSAVGRFVPWAVLSLGGFDLGPI